MKKKSLVLILALTLLMGVAIGGTIAWLADNSGPVVNTFTTSDIDVNLAETTTDYKMIPGYDISKDPKASVTSTSEDCWLFVKLEKTANFDSYMSYTIATGWTKLTQMTDESGTSTNITGYDVYYRKLDSASLKGVSYSVLADDKVHVLDTVTRGGMTSAASPNQPKLTVTAYAHQLHKSATSGDDFTAQQAWYNIANNNKI